MKAIIATRNLAPSGAAVDAANAVAVRNSNVIEENNGTQA